MVVGLTDVGKKGLLVGFGLSMADVLEMSKLRSELLSLLLLDDPSVSLLRLINSVGCSLDFRASISA